MSRNQNYNIAIWGADSITGMELLRLLLPHPNFCVTLVTSREYAGQDVVKAFPHLQDFIHIKFQDPQQALEALEDIDFVFLALPHGVSASYAALIAHKNSKLKIIDLSGDFRLQDPAVYQQYYGQEHASPSLLPQFVYGHIPAHHKALAQASYVANPGCFALTTSLALFPLKGQMQQAKVFAITGSSGGGKKLNPKAHHPLRAHNIFSYGINTHRHKPEIEQIIGIHGSDFDFVPSSGPMVRGIFAHIFVDLKQNWIRQDLEDLYDQAYHADSFVTRHSQVELAHVLGSNACHISINHGQGSKWMIQACLDNLIKGAGGNAVQVANIMAGLPQDLGLRKLSPLWP